MFQNLLLKETYFSQNSFGSLKLVIMSIFWTTQRSHYTIYIEMVCQSFCEYSKFYIFQKSKSEEPKYSLLTNFSLLMHGASDHSD